MSMSATRWVAALGFALISATAQAAPIISPADPALAGATIQNFDTAPAGTFSSLALPGVTISTPSGTLTICTQCGGSGFGDVLQSLNNPSGNNIVFTFNGVVSAFGIQGGAINNAWTYQAFDASNSLIETLNLNDPCCGPFFHGFADPGIKSVVLTANGDWVVFDNLEFVTGSPTSIPEPLTATVFIAGLAGLGALRRRGKAKA